MKHIIMLLITILSGYACATADEAAGTDTLAVATVQATAADSAASGLSIVPELGPMPHLDPKKADELGRKLTLYDLPYSRTTRVHDWKRLGINTVTFIGAGIVTLGVLEMLPEGTTAWDKAEIKHTSFWHRWGNHAADGPVWDKDNFVFNYVLHPYGGAVYFMSARGSGFNMWESLAYSTFISSVLWEYGIECFMEIPSIQDLLITPIAGSIIGEGFYQLKRKIVRNDYTLFGSKPLGHIVAWLIDPLNEFVYLFTGNPNRHKSYTMQCHPSIVPSRGGGTFGLTATITL